jgi:myo-inositol 2-dehydrogenase / D-chiro-inositol 1-dehydrogenase
MHARSDLRRGGAASAGLALSRRTFVAAAVGSAATATILRPETVWGAAANAKIVLGVIGQGGRGAWITKLFAQHGGYQVAALADYFPEVVQASGEALSVQEKRRFSGLDGYKRLLESKVDAGALETPPYAFPEHAAAAVAAGCHVYMAKPVAVDVPGCLAIAELGKQASAKRQAFLVDFQIRTDPNWAECFRRIRQGDLGKLAMICSYYRSDGFPDPAKTESVASRLRDLIWCNDTDLGGTHLVNASIHAIDGALWMAGDKPPVSAMGISRTCRKDPHGDSPDTNSVTLELADGLILNHNCKHHATSGSDDFCGCVVYGQGAMVEGRYTGKTWLHGLKTAFRGGETTSLYQDGAVRNIATFHKSIVEGQFDNPTVGPSVNSTLACILARDAAARGTKLTWNEMLRENRKIEVDLRGLAR